MPHWDVYDTQSKNHSTKADRTDREGEQMTVLPGQFNLSPSVIRHQKETNNNEEDLGTSNQLDLIRIYRTHHPVQNIYPDIS